MRGARLYWQSGHLWPPNYPTTLGHLNNDDDEEEEDGDDDDDEEEEEDYNGENCKRGFPPLCLPTS